LSVTVFIPQQLRSYTGGLTSVLVSGRTVDEALRALDQAYPGIRFRFIDEQDRIREHMRVFVDGERTRTLAQKLGPKSEIHVFGALSGG
jgi:sulfur-carrier protein